MNALHADRISAESYVSFRHNKGVNTKILTVPEILGLTERKIEEEEDMYRVLYKTKVSDEEVKKYLSATFLTGEEFERVDELSLYNGLFRRDNSAYEAAGISMQKLNTLCDSFEYYQEGVGQRLIAGTAYGAYNAVTGYFSNVKEYKTEELRLKNTVFEGDYNTSLKALNYALANVWE